MQERSQEERNQYFEELTRNLNQEGFTAGNETDGLLPVAVEGRRLCTVKVVELSAIGRRTSAAKR